jgi:hypothetical protein
MRVQVLKLEWDIVGNTAHAESETLSGWVEKLQDPHFERWVWIVDVLDDCMTDDMSTSMIGHGIEEKMSAAIAAAENAIFAAEEAMERIG